MVIDLQAEAVNIGGNLVTINDDAENTWIDDNFFAPLLTTGNDSIVTGFTDAAEEGTWRWVSGEEAPWIRNNDPFWWPLTGGVGPAPGNTTYSKWRDGEPNNSGGDENNMRKEYGNPPSHPDFGIWQDYRSNQPGESTHPGLVEVIEFLPPIELVLTVDKATGALSLGTTAAETIFDSYNITSASGALDPTGWNAGNLASQALSGLSADSDGDGDVDGADFLIEQRAGFTPTYLADFESQFGQVGGSIPGAQWEVLNDTTNQLFEAYLSGDETIAPNSSISIGNGYDTANGAEDLVLTFSLPNGKTLTGTVSYINASSAAVLAVPEPSTMALVMITALFGIVTRRRKNIHIQGVLLGVRPMKVFCKLPTTTISALLGLAWLASTAQASFTIERDYRLGDDSAEGAVAGAAVSASGTFDSNAAFTDLSRVTNSPVYTSITDRPDGVTGLGITFDGSLQQYVRGRRLGNPGTSVESTFSAGGSVDYFGTEFRGMQFWTKPGLASGAQTIVMDTNQHGVRISADGFYSMRYAGRDYDTNIPATPGVWRQIMVVVPDAGGALMYIDGIGESAAPGLYNITDFSNLVLGANTHGGESLVSFDGGFKEYYTGTIDDLEMFVLGKNQLGTIDFGTFDFTTDNDFVSFFGGIPANPLDINGDGMVSGDGTGLAGVDDVTAFVDGWLNANRHNGITFPDLSTIVNGDINFDGITDLDDWSLLNAENPAMGAAVLRALAGAVPEPSSGLLLTIVGLLGLPGLRRKACR